MLLEHERNYDLGMDALVTVCSWNTNGIRIWVWMLSWSYAHGTRTDLWFGHGCSGHACSWNKNGIIVRAWMFWSPNALGTRSPVWFGYMDALVIVCATLWFEHSPNLKVHKPSICSLAPKMAAWSTPQMTSEPSNPLESPETPRLFANPF